MYKSVVTKLIALKRITSCLLKELLIKTHLGEVIRSHTIRYVCHASITLR